ncbi:serine/threonine-protein phosphatase 1 regulatory subunit 10-like [Schistocerca cancellata]|uniref:serine/threonine-protein phosphatase 1 regulatory subunit 10-like n=1 Tax=Schistocerca cancellata TaxID=274614 RepID=UPI002117EE90|nr:serine/threonine-protein phosphatase 1 regulatory subunit 10-like [Schistocerca cancellata]XP_049788425.1 serine/threonine-protein phosphatase 1 regulatory subunit 10-like [Schistocerca cancellata]
MTIYCAMPRIDPLQLLRCLSVLLSPDGGIKSHEEVQRLASLMTKFSKKLVSKCIYIQILKSTRTDLLGMFMGAGGWNLTHTWLSDAIVVKNWPLIQELLELLLMCPVDVERLKTNNCPKLIKGLSKDGSSESVRLLASKLVEQWLRIVKGESVELNANIIKSSEPQLIAHDSKENSVSTAEVQSEPSDVTPVKVIKKECEDKSELQVKKEDTDVKVTPSDVKLVGEEKKPEVHIESVKEEEKEEKVLNATQTEETGTSEDSGEDTTWNVPMGQLPVYKITIRDGKQVLAKVTSADRPKKVNAETPETVIIDTTNVQKCDSAATAVTESSDLVNKDVENVETKLTVELKAPVTKSKKKLDKSENSSVTLKGIKESQKKVKDVKGPPNTVKTPEKKNIKSAEFVKEKTKVINKDKNKEKLKNKNKEKGKEKEKEKLNEVEKEGEKGRSKEGEKERLKGGDREKVKEVKLQEKKTETDKDQLEKDNAALAKLIPPSISKLGKIPKKVHTDDSQAQPEVKPVMSEVKKPPEIKQKKLSISIEVRKPTGDASRPKTVKTYNSKFRSTGLEEEVKPPPPRPLKKPVTLDKRPVKFPVLKRPSPVKEIGPPEKKLKPALTDVTSGESKKTEKSGAIKLIPPRPKPCFLQESDMFMDALNASTKKEPRKRKRRISNSKDVPEPKKDGTGKDEECSRDTTPPESPVPDENKSPPIVKPTFKFYQDTLETDDDKPSEDNPERERNMNIETEASKDKEDEENTKSTAEEVEDVLKVPLEESENRIVTKEENSNESTDETQSDSLEEHCVRLPKGVLIYHKTRKGPKKNVRWKAEKDLEDVRFFELDETERVNVTKNFMDMKQMERSHEREAFLLSRKLPQDDIMEEKTTWQPLIPIDVPTNLVEPGKNSREKEIQYAREKIVLQALYFSRSMIPDSPAEPDMEIHATTDPVIIPLDDITGNPDSVNDFQNTPWPEPKLAPPSPPHQYPVPQPQFPTFQQPQQFPPQPVFPPQQNIPPANMTPPVGMMVPNSMNTGGGDWRTGDGKIVPINEMPVPMDMYNPGMPPMNMGMPPNIPGPMPEMSYGMIPDEMNQGAPYPMQGFPMAGPPNMFGPYRGGAQGHNMRGHNMGGGGRGRGGRGQWFNPIGGGGGSGGGGGWQRGGRGGRGSWNGPSRTPCKHFRNGYCRQGDKCPFLHPGVNGPQY